MVLSWHSSINTIFTAKTHDCMDERRMEQLPKVREETY
jgi:hypothetical protein